MNRRLQAILRRLDGPRTAELTRTAGGFGLGQVPERLAPERTTAMVCGFCATGCSLDVHLRDGLAVNLTPSVDYPVNRGMACPKGWEALAPLRAADRLRTPLYRREKGAPLEPIGWAEAIDIFVRRMRGAQAEHGPESLAYLSTGQLPTEEMALLGALGRFGMGIVHCDSNTRQCMATAATAYKESFGFDAPPYSYADLEESDVIVLVGSNLAIAHPILWERVLRNPHRPQIIVVDPRRTETAVAATQHYAIEPKSDLALLYGLARRLIELGAVDHEFIASHTSGFDEFAAHVAQYDLATTARTTGLPTESIETLARTIAEGERVSFWWTMGVNQSHQGVRTAQAIIDLALLTGNIGRPGTGANSVTGQCNAMGSRLFSNTVSLLGGRDFTNAAHRAAVAEVLGVEEEAIPRQPGMAYDQILDAVETGTIRALWIIATNTAHSWIDQSRARERLRALDFLVVQDLYADTETAKLADLVLPAAGWGEKDGTFINSERRIGVIKKVLRAPGEALADFWIFKAIAEAWGCGAMFERWDSPESTFTLLAELSRGMPFDFSGVEGYAHLDMARGIQWPAPAGQVVDVAAERRLFRDGRFFTPDGRARFVFDKVRSAPHRPDERYPLVLLSGRGTSAEWHTGTRTDRSPLLRSMAPSELEIDLDPADAQPLQITSGDTVTVASAHGEIAARARVTPTMGPGRVFLPMHRAATNQLTAPVFDPHSRQPSYKYTAVRVTKARPEADHHATSHGGTDAM